MEYENRPKMSQMRFVVMFHAVESGWNYGCEYIGLENALKVIKRWAKIYKAEYSYSIMPSSAFIYKREIDSDIMYNFKEEEPSKAEIEGGGIRCYEWFDFPVDGRGIYQFSTGNTFPSVERIAKVFHLSVEDIHKGLEGNNAVYETDHDAFCKVSEEEY